MKATLIIFAVSLAVLIITLIVEKIVYKGIEKAPKDSPIALIRDASAVVTVMLFFWILLCIFG